MTTFPPLSTVLLIKGILEKIHKFQFISSGESDESIVFPRLKKRLLQTKDATDKPSISPVWRK
jgi:hypothetical protein